MSLKLSAGDFNKRVRIRKYGKVTNNEGGQEQNGVLIEILTWAAEVKWDQRRLIEAGKVDLLNTRMLYIRYAQNRAQIDVNWKIEIDGTEHNIFSKPVLKESGLKVFEITAKAK